MAGRRPVPISIRAAVGTILGLALAALPAATPARACAACGCSLSTDGAMGFSPHPGFQVTLQTDYIDQDQLRSGTRSVSAAQVAALNTPAPGSGQEVENGTLNRYTTLGLVYSNGSDWNFRLLMPYVDRDHSTYGPASNPLTPDQLSSARVSGVGDAKIIAGYSGLLPRGNLTLQVGLKLPTGAYGGQNANGGPVVGRHPVSFGPAGNSGGMLLDTSLQAGTGSTDLILGALYHQPLSENVRGFAMAQVQTALAEKLDQLGSDYRPGNQANLTLGVRYESRTDLVPQLQLNYTHKSADQGALADTADTAGTTLFLSPGIIGRITSGLQAFAFVQLPVYSNLSGYQLFPRWTGTLGIAYRF